MASSADAGGQAAGGGGGAPLAPATAAQAAGDSASVAQAPAPRAHGQIQPLRVQQPFGKVQLEASDNYASEYGDTGEFTISRDHVADSLTVSYDVSGTAEAGRDYQRLSGTVTLEPGQNTEAITIDPIDDLIPDSGETVVLTLQSVSDSRYAIDAESQSDTVTIYNSESGGSVWVSATDNMWANEDGDTGEFTVERSDAIGSLTVYYSVSGTAIEGTDYDSLAGSVTIADGSSGGTITISPIDDLDYEGDEDVVLTLTSVSDTSYAIEPYGDTVWIADNDSSGGSGGSVWIDATDASANEDGDPGEFTIVRSDSGGTVTVNYSVSGGAIEGTDYDSLAGSVTIADGSSGGTITISPIDDLDYEGDEDVVLTLESVSDTSYQIDSTNNTDVVWIDDNESSGGLISIEATDSAAYENGQDPAEFTIRRDNSGGNLAVYYHVSGGATEGVDYADLTPHELTIPDGAYEATVAIAPYDDNYVEGDEDVVLTLASHATYTIDATAESAGITIYDDDTSNTTVTIEATDPEAQEAGKNGAEEGEFTIRRDNSGGSLTVNFSVGGVAIEGDDYDFKDRGTREVTFADGQLETTITLEAMDDGEDEGEEDVVVTLTSGAYMIGTANSDTVTILDSGVISTQSKNADSHCDCDCGCKPVVDVEFKTGQLIFNPLAAFGLPMPLFFPSYSSNENPHPITLLDVHLPDGTLPEYYEAQIDFGGIMKTVDVSVPTGWSGGEVARLGLQVDAGTLSTGRHAYSVTLTPKFSDGSGGYTSGTAMTHSGAHEVFNRKESVYGNRWWTPALDELQISSGGASLIRGKGTAAWYSADGSGGYGTPEGTFSQLVAEADGTYTLRTHHHGQTKKFAADGRLTKIVDANGQETHFSYTDTDGDGQARELSQITNPMGRTFDYSYSGGQLSSVTDFQGRQFDFAYDADGRVTSVTAPDPDGSGGASAPQVTLGYDPTTSLLTSITDPADNTTTIAYGSDLRVRSLTHPGDVTETYDPVQVQGLDQFVLLSSVVGTATSAEGHVQTYETDGFGYVTETTDPRDHTTQYERDENGQITRTLNAIGESVSYEYDKHGRKLAAHYDDGTSETWTYDETKPLLRKPLSYTNRLNQTWNYTYDSNGNRLTETDPLSNTTSYTYNAMGLVTSVTEPDPDGTGEQVAPVTNYAYDPLGQLIKITFADSTFREYTYDTAGNLTSETDELGRVTSFSYDALGRKISMTLPDPDGSGGQAAPVYQYAYDAMGRLVNETDPLGNVTSFGYDAHGSLTLMTLPDPDGSGAAAAPTVSYSYDADGRLLTETNPLGHVTTYAYDASGNLTSTTLPDPDGSGGQAAPVFSSTYDDLNRLVSGTDPLGRTTSYAYDPDGYLASVTDPLSRVTTYNHDEEGQLLSLTLPDPDGSGGAAAVTISYGYDAAGNLLTETDPLGNTTSYVYDNLYRVTSVTSPDPDNSGGASAPVTQYEFDSVGNLVSEIDPLGNMTSYQYDHVGNLTQMTLPDPDGSGAAVAPVYEYSYDGLNRLITETDPLDRATSHAYDANGNLTSVTDPLGRMTSYGYDGLGRQTSMTLPDPDGSGGVSAPVTTFNYDAAGKLVSEVDALGNTTTYSYDNLGRRIQVTEPDPDGSGGQSSPVWQYAYDLAGQLISESDPLGNITSYGYDDVGNRTSMTQPDPDGSGTQTRPVWQYTFDGLDQLTSVTDPLNNATTYSYDANGNLTSETDRLGNTTAYIYDDLGRRIQVTEPDPDGSGGQSSPVWQYAYDAAGRLTSVTDPLSGVTAYAYDNLDRTTSVTDPLSRQTSYGYDSAGQRTSLTNPLGQTTQYAYDDAGNLLSVTEPDPDGSGGAAAPVTSYSYDDLNRQISVTDPLNQTTSSSYDALGRMLTETDALGQVTTYAYDDLGRLIGVTAPDPDAGGALSAAVTQFEYDALGRQTAVIDPLNQRSESAYDNLSRLISETDPETGATTYVYDALGNRTSLTDPVGNTTSWTYDAEGRVLSETNELADTRVFDYDNLGRLIERTDRNGRIREFDYDALGRNTEERWIASDGITVVNTLTWTYDAASQLDTVGDNDSAYDYAYDSGGRLTQVDNLGTPDMPHVVHDYGYDNLGRRTSASATIDSTADFTNSYRYDAAGRMTRIEQNGISGGAAVANKRIDLTYDGLGRFDTITRYEDLAGTEMVATSDYSFDHAGRLTALDHMGPGSTSLANYSYTYDVAGRITAMTTPDGSATYNYDATDQLIGADYDFQADEDYTYDANGNRTGDLHETGANNQLLSDGAYNYEYDAEGNRVRKSSRQLLVTGADAGGGPDVRVYDGSDGTFLGNFMAYKIGMNAGVRVAVGDVNGDGVDDIVTSPGSGGGPHVKVFDGTDPTGGTPITDFFAFDVTFTKGVFVALGDVDGDGQAEIITSMDGGDTPTVRVFDFDGTNTTLLAEFDAYASTFPGGVRVAAGDVLHGDGVDDIVTSPGSGGGPDVRVFDGNNLTSGFAENFNAYAGTFTGGVYVATGDVNGDGRADIVTGPGSSGGPNVRVFDATNLNTGAYISNFNAYDPAKTAGVRVATTDTDDADGRADIVTVLGSSEVSEVRIFDGDDNQMVDSFTAYGTFLGGAFVGGTGNNAREDVHYEWDHQNQLTRVEFYDVNGDIGKAVEFDYDVHGRRIRKRVLVDNNGTLVLDRAEKYVYDSAGKTDPATGVPLDDVVLVFNDTGSLTNRYLHGPAIDQVFASDDDLGEILWGLDDHQGTVRDVVDYDAGANATTVANHRQFDAFGNLTGESDAEVDFLFSYTGRIYDADAELYYYRARWYDPVMGRFVSEDPIGFAGGEANLRRYVGNNPVWGVDPSGRDGLSPHELQSIVERFRSGNRLDNPHLPTNRFRNVPISSLHMRCAICHGTPDGTFNNIAFTGSTADATPLQAALLQGDFSQVHLLPPPKPEPDFVDPRVRAGAEVAASITPYVGEAMDFAVLFGDGYEWWERTLAGASLGVNAVSAGFFPNFGGFLRASDELAALGSDVNRCADDTAEFMVHELDDLKSLNPKDFETEFPVLIDAPGQGSTAPYRGGSHREMSQPVGDGLDSHHMPDRGADANVDPLDGPAIQMDPPDHWATSSNGRHGHAGAQYRAETAEMIQNGRSRDAMAREIRDVRRAAEEVSNDPSKYNAAVREMLEYARQSGQLP